jgi:hypothetical protein
MLLSPQARIIFKPLQALEDEKTSLQRRNILLAAELNKVVEEKKLVSRDFPSDNLHGIIRTLILHNHRHQ